MSRRLLVSALAMALAAPVPVIRAQTSELDKDLAKGIKQVDDGDYDGAILSLDTVARRLATMPARSRDLSQAYLYLGIAYVGKGQEAAARARFREALGQAKDLRLSPDSFPPKVINLFEAAKEELGKTPPPAAATQATPEKKSGGGGKALLIVGGLVAVGGGVALAAGGSKGSSASSTPTTTLPARKTDMFPPQGLRAGNTQGFSVVATDAGTLQATVTWVESNAQLTMDFGLHDAPYTHIASSVPTSNTSASVTAAVTGSTQYDVFVNNFSGVNVSSFTLTVVHP